MKEQINIAENKARCPRPSLQATGHQTVSDNWRILQQLEHQTTEPAGRYRRPHWHIEQRIIWLGVLLASTCASMWYLLPHASLTRKPAIPRFEATIAQAQAAPAAVPVTTELRTEAAQIVNLSSATDPRQLSPADISTARPVQAEPPLPRIYPHHEPQYARKPADAADAPHLDRDAALLAALVAHGHANQNRGTVSNRDIVERNASDSTLALLQRCQQLGTIEGMLCRSRICADRWDSDQACRLPSATPASQ